ncbi:cupin domain-containing protein [Thermodesulfobacteriota bacterium]
MEMQITKLSELPAKDVSGHEGFVARSMLNLPEKKISVRVLSVTPGGIGPVPAHSHSDTHLFLVLEGQLELDIEGSLHLVPSGSCIEVPPNRQHQLRCSGEFEMTVLAIKWN